MATVRNTDPSSPADHRERLLFTFAVIADTHVNQGEDNCNSPFDVNRLANGRLRYVVDDLNRRDVAFVIHLGDIVHPVPAIPDLYEEAARRFHKQASRLRHRLYLVPGNHDVGDKPNPWAPTGVVSDAYIALWQQHFGPQYFSFEHEDCLFVAIDAQILNSGLACEEEQRVWLEALLKKHQGARIFLNLHYPPYLSIVEEPENYDNLAEPARSWLLDLVESYKIEALFAGHVHNFWYDRYGSSHFYYLPSTAFVRQDYSEMFRRPPGVSDEAGRNDKPKLGYFLVHVYEDGHLCEAVRTYGRTAQEAGQRPKERIRPIHPQLNDRAPFGVDMRQSWLERIEISPTGGLDEFDRKAVRNDYVLLALWEMGVRKLRIPLQDLRSADGRRRLRQLHSCGIEFNLFSFGMPDKDDLGLLSEVSDIVHSWEIAYAPHTVGDLVGDLRQIREDTGIPIYLSPLHSKEDINRRGGRYYHVINHGFHADDGDGLKALCERPDVAEAVDGFVYRLAKDVDPWDEVLAVGSRARALDKAASLHMRVAGANPAEATLDDSLLANRVAGALAAALTQENVSVYLDTFADNDRGYFVRHGVVDRLFNPRPAYYVVRNLYGVLNANEAPLHPGDHGTFDHGRFTTMGAEEKTHILILPEQDCSQVSLPWPRSPGCGDGRIGVSNLISGEITTVDGRKPRQANLELDMALQFGNPVLLTLE